MTTTFRMRNDGSLVTELEYRLAHPTVFPVGFAPDDADPVIQTPMPSKPGHYAVRAGVEQDVLGNWVEKWDFVAYTEEELARLQKENEDKLYRRVVELVQARLDAFARERSYDSILSACTYATSSIARFRDDGQLCVDLRDSTWAELYSILEKIRTNELPVPKAAEDVLPLLPQLVWPT